MNKFNLPIWAWFLANNPWVLGLTGGIGSGKSTASRYLANAGIKVVDADKVAREVVEPGTEGLTAIVARYGAEVLTAQEQLNRAKLREVIFSDDQEKQWLNGLLHPLIRSRMLNQLRAAQSPYVVLEAPLLFENSLDKYCNRTLLIDVPVEVQVQRASVRDDVTEEQIRAIIASQLSRTEKVQRTDDIITNCGSMTELEHKVKRYHESYLRLLNLQSS